MRNCEYYEQLFSTENLDRLSRRVSQAEQDRLANNYSPIFSAFNDCADDEHWASRQHNQARQRATETQPGIVPGFPELNAYTVYLLGEIGLARILWVATNQKIRKALQPPLASIPPLRDYYAHIIDRVRSTTAVDQADTLPETTIHGGACYWPAEIARDGAITHRLLGHTDQALEELTTARQQTTDRLELDPTLAKRSALAVILSDLAVMQHTILTHYHAVAEALTVSKQQMNVGRLATVSARATFMALDPISGAGWSDRWDTARIGLQGLWTAFRHDWKNTLRTIARVARR